MYFLAALLVRLGVNVLALIVIDWLFSSITINGFWSFLIGGIVLTLGNAILKPILAILTLPLIIVTLGLSYFAINVAMLALAEWIAPHFSINGFWTYIGATIVVWFVNVVMHWVLDKIRID
jgi:putative membrane protein